MVRLTYRDATALLRRHDPEQAPPQGHRFSLGVTSTDGRLLALAMLARPTDPALDDGLTAELTLWHAEHHRRAARHLLIAVARIAATLGYHHLITTGIEAGQHRRPQRRHRRP